MGGILTDVEEMYLAWSSLKQSKTKETQKGSEQYTLEYKLHPLSPFIIILNSFLKNDKKVKIFCPEI